MKWNTALEALKSAWDILSILISVLIMRGIIDFFLQNDSLKQSVLTETRVEWEREFTDQGRKATPRGRQGEMIRLEKARTDRGIKKKLKD